MSIIDICYTAFRPENQSVAPTIPGFQGIKLCIQYLTSQPHKTTFILPIIMMAQMLSDLHGLGIKFKTTQTRII